MTGMSEKIWKIRRGTGDATGETIYTTERGFAAALQDAWRYSATDVEATLPDGTVLNNAELRARYPRP
jgi:hypothetical protein